MSELPSDFYGASKVLVKLVVLVIKQMSRYVVRKKSCERDKTRK